MDQAVILLLTTVTSMVALWFGARALTLRPGKLWPALGGMLECVGTMLLFLTVNVTIGAIAIILVRTLTGTFVSTYVLLDAAVIGVSCLQGLVFQCWRSECRGGR